MLVKLWSNIHHTKMMGTSTTKHPFKGDVQAAFIVSVSQVTMVLYFLFHFDLFHLFIYKNLFILFIYYFFYYY